MKAFRNLSLKRKFFAGALSLIAALLALFVAVPTGHKKTSFETVLVYAGALNSATISAPLKIAESLILEPGSTIRISQTSEGTANQDGNQNKAKFLELINATITIEQSPATGSSRAVDPTRPLTAQNVTPLATALSTLGFKELHLNGTTLQLRRPGGGRNLVGKVIAKITVSENSHEIQATGKFMRQGKTVDFSAVVGLQNAPNNSKPLRIKISGRKIEFDLDGQLFINGGVRVTSEKTSVTSTDVKHILAWLGMGPINRSGNSSGFSTFLAKGHLKWTGSTLAFDQALFDIDGNQAKGRMSFNFDPREPSIDGTLAFEALDLTPYLQAGHSSSSTSPTQSSLLWQIFQSVASQRELPLGLKEIDADIRLSAKSIQASGVDIGSGAAVILVKNGKLHADIADMTLPNGSKGRVQIEIDTTGFVPEFVVRGNVNNVDLGVASTSWVGKPVIDGMADITFDLSAQGRTTPKLLSTLSGPIIVTAQQRASVPIDVEELFKAIKLAPNDGWDTLAGGYTALSNLSVKLMSSKGTLKTELAQATFGDNTLTVEGTLSLTDLILDIVLTKLATSPESAVSPAPMPDENPAPAENHDSLEFKGPITKPVIRFLPPSQKS